MDSSTAKHRTGGFGLVDQLLGIGGLSVLTFVVFRLVVVLREAWHVQTIKNEDRDLFDL
jgi:hypothetical protein